MDLITAGCGLLIALGGLIGYIKVRSPSKTYRRPQFTTSIFCLEKECTEPCRWIF